MGVSDLFGQTVNGIQNNKMKKKISRNLRSFSITLYYYSPRAYRFVGKAFKGALPHDIQSTNGSVALTVERVSRQRLSK